MGWTIAIDGPSGSGKSTIASMLARRLGILHLNTGAMYRALGLFALRSRADPSDERAVAPLLDRAEIRVTVREGEQATFLGEEDVSGLLGMPEVSDAASRISALPAVRAHMVALQREIGGAGNVVMDGRDIGTVVMPDATLKIFLTASLEERARRRHRELLAKGTRIDYDTVRSDLAARDERDEQRACAPLAAAPDAYLLDCTELDESAVIARVLVLLEAKKEPR